MFAAGLLCHRALFGLRVVRLQVLSLKSEEVGLCEFRVRTTGFKWLGARVVGIKSLRASGL